MEFLTRSLLALLLVSLSVFEAKSAPSAFDFFKAAEHHNLQLSPNGNKIAFVKTLTQKYCIDRFGKMKTAEKKKCRESSRAYRNKYIFIVHDIESHERLIAQELSDNNYVRWIDWASNDRLLMAIGANTTIGKRGAYSLGGSRIVSVDVSDDGTQRQKPVVLFGDEKSLQRQNRYLSRITNILRNDPEHIIMPAKRSGELDLWKVNVLTGGSERIALGASGTFFWYTDRLGVPSLRFDCQGRTCRKINVYSPDKNDASKWRKVRSFQTKPDENEEDYDFWPIAPSDNPNQYYVLSNEDEDERRSIKLFDIEKEEYVRTVFEHPSVDVGGALRNSQTGEYAGAWFYEDTLDYSINDNLLQKHYDAINKYFGNKANVSLLGSNEAGTRAVVFVMSPQTPGGYYVYNFDTAKIDLLVKTEPGLEENSNSQTDILKVPMRDGSTITAYHSYAKDNRGPEAPLLVIPHGGPEVRDFYDYDYTEQYFVSRGYQTIRMNFRGSSGFGRAFAEAGYGEWGGLMQDDVTDTVKYLFSNNFASSDNTCIVGYSYGGYVALYGAAMTPELYKCVVSGGGVSDLKLMLSNTRKDYGSDSKTYEYWVKSIGSDDKTYLDSRSPVNMAERIKAPVMLAHGEYDGNVYEKQSRRMQKVLKKAGNPAEYLALENAGHGNWDLETEILYHQRLEKFLAKHLTGQTSKTNFIEIAND